MRKSLIQGIALPLVMLLAALTAMPNVGTDAIARADQIAETVVMHATSQPTSNADQATTAALQAVITKANQEQQDAFAQNKPTLMRDTATSSHYQEMVQTNDDLRQSGVTAIKLVNIQFTNVSAKGNNATV